MEQPFNVGFTIDGREYSGGVLLDTDDFDKCVDQMEMICEFAINQYCKRRFGRNKWGHRVVRIVSDGEEYWDEVDN